MKVHAMTNENPAQGWLALALLWIGSFVDHLFSAAGLNVLVSVAVLVLTLLQIRVTWRRLRKPIVHPATDWDTL
jgi:predicted membrane chloride channel (bestrophin family)